MSSHIPTVCPSFELTSITPDRFSFSARLTASLNATYRWKSSLYTMSSLVPTNTIFTFSDGLCSLLFCELTVIKSLSPKFLEPLEVIFPLLISSNYFVFFINPLCDLVSLLFKAAPVSCACVCMYFMYSLISYSKF